MHVTLYVGNLSSSTTEVHLMTLFSRIGEVTGLRIQKDPHSGASRGFGYLTMSAASEADRAVSRLNDYMFDGCRLKVRLARRRWVSGGASTTYDSSKPD